MGSIQETATGESKKIAANIRDLEKTLAALNGEKGQLGAHVSKRQEEISIVEKTIRQELEPKLEADKKELGNLVDKRGKLLLVQLAIERPAILTVRHQALGKEPKRKGTSGEAKPSPDPDDYHLRNLADEITAILKEWWYLNTDVVEFNKEMDMVVAGQPRRNRGKAIRAVLHFAFTIDEALRSSEPAAYGYRSARFPSYVLQGLPGGDRGYPDSLLRVPSEDTQTPAGDRVRE